MTTRYLVGTTLDVLATLPEASVDLVATSPPFLGLRSYLRADHPTKHREIGSETTPADFLDTMLDVVEACDRVLAPHGSLAFDNGVTVEVNRTVTDGYKNANSMLYGACSRIAFALGFERVISYTEKGESGASLRAAGYRVIAERPARGGWDSPSRPREPGRDQIPRRLWEAGSGPWSGVGVGGRHPRDAPRPDTDAAPVAQDTSFYVTPEVSSR